MNSEIVKCYGYLTVIKDTWKKHYSAKIYKCRCVGGKEIEANINKLHTLRIKSCACWRFRRRDLTDQKFGRLTVIDLLMPKIKELLEVSVRMWNVCYVTTVRLTTVETVSFGCKNDENRSNIPNLDRGLVDGTMKAAIQKNRKRNRNN